MKQFEDRLAKYVAGNLFGEYARVEIGTDLLPDTFRADVILIPEKPIPGVVGAGLLTSLTGDARCLIEPFSGVVESIRLEGNLTKLRLLLQRAHKDGLGVKRPKGVLWLIVTYWPKKAIEETFGEEGELVEDGIRRWKGFHRETVYMVNTAEISLREDTILFRLFGRDKHRKEAMIKIFTEHLEPYVTLLNQFDMRFREMAETEKLVQLDPEELKNLIDLRDTREEVLRELGKKEGREEGKREAYQEFAKKMLEIGEPPEKVASLTGLSLEDIQKLQ
jgi:hypothetical protein